MKYYKLFLKDEPCIGLMKITQPFPAFQNIITVKYFRNLQLGKEKGNTKSFGQFLPCSCLRSFAQLHCIGQLQRHQR